MVALLCVGLLLWPISRVEAQETFEYTQSVKDLGRGGVRIPSETDGSMMFYNPAMLAFTKGIRWSVLDLGLGAGGTLGAGEQSVLQNAGNLATLYGNNIWLGGMGRTAMSFPNWGMAIYGNLTVDALLKNPAFTTMSVAADEDYGFLIGGAFNLGPSLAFGVNFKRVTRTGGTANITTAQLVAGGNLNTLLTGSVAGLPVGTGYGDDVGLIWKPNVTANPIVSICWQDLGYTSFVSTGPVAPPPIEDNLVLGLSAHQDMLGVGWGAGLEYRHIDNIDVDISKKFNAGLELDLALVDLRYGFYQGWPGYGASIDLWFLSIDAAYYTVELGPTAGQQPDYRYQVGISFEAGFDPFFNLSDIGGGGPGGRNRHLKQRR